MALIGQQPATASFMARHLYNFFVAAEPQVPAWPTVPPRDPAALDTLRHAFISSGDEIRPGSTLRGGELPTPHSGIPPGPELAVSNHLPRDCHAISTPTKVTISFWRVAKIWSQLRTCPLCVIRR
jgi:hypothetical protein